MPLGSFEFLVSGFEFPSDRYSEHDSQLLGALGPAWTMTLFAGDPKSRTIFMLVF
jgi:hypothetical protein